MGKLINKEEFDRLIRSSGMMKWAAKELELAGYTEGDDDNPNTWMREQVLESLAVFVSHGNSGGSAPFEINLVKRLSSWKPITKLRFTDDEWAGCITGGCVQNNRCSAFFKDPDGTISWVDAVTQKVVSQIRYNTKEESTEGCPTYWSFSSTVEGTYVDGDLILTGNIYHSVQLKEEDVQNGFYVPDTTYLNVVCVEIEPDSWLSVVVDTDDSLKEVKRKYVLKTTYIDELKGVFASELTPEHEKLIIEKLREERNDKGKKTGSCQSCARLL